MYNVKIPWKCDAALHGIYETSVKLNLKHERM